MINRWPSNISLLCLLLFVLSSMLSPLCAQTPKGEAETPKPDPKDMSIIASVRVTQLPPKITIQWLAPTLPCYSYTVYRRQLGEKGWDNLPIAELTGDATSYTDSAVLTGVSYEYRIDRLAATYHGIGYICAGIDLPLVEERGGVLLLVDSSLSELAAELQRLQLDLIGDGWRVVRLSVPRSATVVQVKELIKEQYRTEPRWLTSVLLIGHIAVPYSGEKARDGHEDHTGAWSTDLFYGTMNLIWEDTADHPISYSKGNAVRNWNKPGDGKFDLDNVPPNSVQLQVGRIDLSNLPSFTQDEVTLLRQYLNKNHRFRHAQLLAERRGIVRDSFGLFGHFAFSAGGWSNMAACFGTENVASEAWFTTPPRSTYPLMGFGAGGGSATSCEMVGNTTDFREKDSGILFTTLFGSYFGDWDVANSLLRSVLASRNSGLTAIWSGYPPAFLHPLGLGLPIGYAIQRSQNNGNGTDYPTWELPEPLQPVMLNSGGGSVTLSLMGDPTLHLFVVDPPTQLTATINGGISIHWEASNDTGVSGYHIYRSNSLNGSFTRLTNEPVRDTYYFDPTAFTRPLVYMVKAIKLEQTGSGSFYNSSQGVFITVGKKNEISTVPIVLPLSYVTRQNTTIPIRLKVKTSVGHPISYSFAQPRHGTLTGKPPTLIYTPDQNYSGSDLFSYTALIDESESEPATVMLNVRFIEKPPLAREVIIARHPLRSVPCVLSVLDNLPRTLKYQIVQPPKYGLLSGTAPALIYTPTSSANVADSFTYTASFGSLTSQIAKVILEADYLCPKLTTPIVVDGNLQDWQSLPYNMAGGVRLDEDAMRQWKNAKNCDYHFGVCYDNEFVYFGINVIDDFVVSFKELNPWSQDGIEVRIDARPDEIRFAGNGSNELVDFLFYAISPSRNVQEAFVYQKDSLLADSRYVCIRNNRGYTMELAIPRSYFTDKGGKDSNGFRMNIGVNDFDAIDGSVPIAYYRWKPDWRSWTAIKSYNGSGTFRLQ